MVARLGLINSVLSYRKSACNMQPGWFLMNLPELSLDTLIFIIKTKVLRVLGFNILDCLSCNFFPLSLDGIFALKSEIGCCIC